MPGKTGDSEQLLAAAESSGLAAQASPDISEAVFNHAIALEALHLSNQARLAWDKYLKLDGDSAWASARARRAALDKPTPAAQWDQLKGELLRRAKGGDGDGVRNLIEQFPGMARNYVRDEAFRRMGRGCGDRRRRVVRTPWSRLRGRRRNLRAASPGSVHCGRRADSGKRQRILRTLSEAHLELRSAQTYYDKKDLISALRHFEQAQAGFARAGDLAFAPMPPSASRVATFITIVMKKRCRRWSACAHSPNNAIIRTSSAKRGGLQGPYFLSVARHAAIYAYQSALPLYSLTEDWESHAHISVASGNAFDISGKRSSLIHIGLTGLKISIESNTASRRCALLKAIAIVLARNRRVGIALNFAQEEMDTAVAIHDDCEIPIAFYVRGGLYRDPAT